jgi:hypothetical protein
VDRTVLNPLSSDVKPYQPLGHDDFRDHHQARKTFWRESKELVFYQTFGQMEEDADFVPSDESKKGNKRKAQTKVMLSQRACIGREIC